MESGESQNPVGEGKDSPQFPSGLSLIHKISNRPTVICEKIWKHELFSQPPWGATHHSGALAPEHLHGATSAVSFRGGTHASLDRGPAGDPHTWNASYVEASFGCCPGWRSQSQARNEVWQ